MVSEVWPGGIDVQALRPGPEGRAARWDHGQHCRLDHDGQFAAVANEQRYLPWLRKRLPGLWLLPPLVVIRCRGRRFPPAPGADFADLRTQPVLP
jgi:hypothetical protein